MNEKLQPTIDAITSWLRANTLAHLTPYNRMNNGAKNRAQAAVTLSKRFDGMVTQLELASGSYRGSTGQYNAIITLEGGSLKTKCNCNDHERNRGKTCKHTLATVIHWARKLKHPDIEGLVSKWGGADTGAAAKAEKEKQKAEKEKAKQKAEEAKRKKEEAARKRKEKAQAAKAEKARAEKARLEAERKKKEKAKALAEKKRKEKEKAMSTKGRFVEGWKDIYAIGLAASKAERTGEIRWYTNTGDLNSSDFYRDGSNWEVDIGRGPREDEYKDRKEWVKIRNAGNRACKAAIKRLGLKGVTCNGMDDKGYITITFKPSTEYYYSSNPKNWKNASARLVAARTLPHKVEITTNRREARILASEMADVYAETTWVYKSANGFVVIVDSQVARYPKPLPDQAIVEMYE